MLTLIASTCLGCVGSSGLRPPPAEFLEDYETQIRVSVISILVGPDGPPRGRDPGLLYVQDKDGASTTVETRRAVQYLSRERGLRVVWVDSWKDVGLDRSTGKPISRGLLIGLGSIEVVGEDYSLDAWVSTSINSESGQGATYTFQRLANGWWLVAESNGWIS